MIRYRLRLSRTLCDKSFFFFPYTFIIQHSCIYTSFDFCTGWFDLDSALERHLSFFFLSARLRFASTIPEVTGKKEKSSETRGVFWDARVLGDYRRGATTRLEQNHRGRRMAESFLTTFSAKAYIGLYHYFLFSSL